MKNPTNFLVYLGTTGVGKTYFCAALVEWIVTYFDSFRYYNEADLFNRLRDSIDTKVDYHKTLEMLLDDDIIILDDIGSSGLTEWRVEQIFAAIDERYNSMKPTIITSNLIRRDFEKMFHQRVVSRLFSKDNIIIEINDETLDRRLN